MKKFLLAILLIIAFSSAAFASLPTVIMLSTQDCPACMKMSGVLREINTQYRGRINTAHIYLENNPDIARKYNVRFVPTLIFRDSTGKEIAQEIGYRPANEVIKVFKDAGVNI